MKKHLLAASEVGSKISKPRLFGGIIGYGIAVALFLQLFDVGSGFIGIAIRTGLFLGGWVLLFVFIVLPAINSVKSDNNQN